ncbi:ABC transporter substrate-binding protein [Agrobacterium sp. NPDC089420]|uniref:ABC transporter substrate-binding protein n=1 Tax=Agrobacterium sp. NPDC089420 TaxID=3363918 RepID=UPI00384AB7A2
MKLINVRNKIRMGAATSAIAAALIFSSGNSVLAETTIQAVMHAPLRVLDPVMSSAYISRDFGYMIYDTLVAMDEKFQIKPQMADWKISDDGLVYTFTLREGLLWSDGTPVTAEDCVASLQRWEKRDSMGQVLAKATKSLEATDAKTITLTLSKPVGIVLEALGKPSSLVPFMMPKAVASTPADKPITSFVGSGPFKFVESEFQPGVKAAFVKNEKYAPRAEPPSWLSGGKVVKVDRVEWIVMPDAQTAINALANGEIDYIDEPQIDLLPLLDGNKEIIVKNNNPFGLQILGRMNFLYPPFDNVKVRRAAFLAMSQPSFMAAMSSDPSLTKVCGAVFFCDTPLTTEAGSETLIAGSGMEQAKAALKESGYDGTPIRIIQPTDVNTQKPQPIVAAQLLQEAGFKVQLLPMDWQSAVALRNNPKPPSEGGWNMAFTGLGGMDVSSPLTSLPLNTVGKDGWPGWPKDDKIIELREAFALTKTPEDRRKVAEELQKRIYDQVIYIPLGQLKTPAAWSAKLHGVLDGPAVPFFWNIEKKAD